MAVVVRIPTPLQKLTGDKAEVEASGRTVQDLLADLESRYPGFKERLCDPQGKLRRFVNLYVNEEDIRFLQAEATPLKDGDEVSIIPAIAGGGGTPRSCPPAGEREGDRPSPSLKEGGTRGNPRFPLGSEGVSPSDAGGSGAR